MSQHVVLNARGVVAEFELAVTTMSNLDYDLDELLSETVQVLSKVEGQVGDGVGMLASTYRTHGSFTGETTEDGEILAHAIEQLGNGLHTLIDEAGLYSENGRHEYRYANLLARDLVLTKTTNPS